MADAKAHTKRMNVFERYLSLWVAVCMVLGVAIGKLAPEAVGMVRDLEFGEGSQINVPIAVLIWLMIYPMMLKIDFASIRDVGRRPRGLFVTLFVNWLVKPFSMAFFGWLFFQKGICFHLTVDGFKQFETRELQQLDGLLQLWRHDELLR